MFYVRRPLLIVDFRFGNKTMLSSFPARFLLVFRLFFDDFLKSVAYQ